METTRFRSTPAPNRLLKSQIVLYIVSGLLSLVFIAAQGRTWWTHRHDAQVQVQDDPESFRGGLIHIFSLWQRDVLHSTPPTPAPVSAIRPAAQVQPTATPAQVAQVQDTPPPNNHRHIPASDVAGTDPDARFSPPVAQPTPWQPPQMDMDAVRRDMQATAPGAPVARTTPTPGDQDLQDALARSFATPTPDPVAAKHAAWRTLYTAYVQQVKTRIAAAHSDAEKAQIRQDITLWQQKNPEPPKHTAN